MEEEVKAPQGSALEQVITESLDMLSLDELAVRKTLLKTEIMRIEASMTQKKGSRDAAEALFGTSED
ncbi:MAG: DUF1192 family protein [Parvibaculales bacterium]